MFCNLAVPIPQFIDYSENFPIGVDAAKNVFFEQLLCTESMNIPLQTQWVLLIYPESPNLQANIINTAKTHDPAEWLIEKRIALVNKDEYQYVIGCVFAQDVRLPGENLGVDFAGGSTEGNMGFMKGPIATNRDAYPNLEIGFLETNHSFTDFFIKPWVMLVGYRGLIARPTNTSVKATIEVIQLGKSGVTNTNSIRKILRFHGAAPINVNTEDLSYDIGSLNQLKRQCQFTYNKLQIIEG